MSLNLFDRVKETCSAPGTGTVTLLGAVLGFQSFSIVGNANTCYYTIADQYGANWEVGIGTYTLSGTTLARTTVLSSSAGGTIKANFSSGTQDVFVTYPAKKSVYLDSNGNINNSTGNFLASAGLATTGTFTATPPAHGLVMDYATGFGRFSAFAGDGFQWYNAGVANTKLMQLSSTGVITTATWNGATVGVAYGGTGLTNLTAGYIPFGNGTSAFGSAINLFWDSANNRLGIGLATPSYTLHVNGSVSLTTGATATPVIVQSGGPNQGTLRFGSGGNPYTIFGGDDYGIIGFSIGSDQKMQIASSGGVSIGNTTDPGAGNLSVTGTGYFGSTLLVGTTSYSQTGNGFRATPASGISCATQGGINLGLDKPASPTQTAFQTFYVNASLVGYINYNGVGITYNTISDERLKENISDAADSLSVLNTIKVRQFDWKINSQHQNFGFIAQELEQIYPEAVSKGIKDDDTWGVEYGMLVPLLVKSIQEQQIIIEQLKLKVGL